VTASRHGRPTDRAASLLRPRLLGFAMLAMVMLTTASACEAADGSRDAGAEGGEAGQAASPDRRPGGSDDAGSEPRLPMKRLGPADAQAIREKSRSLAAPGNGPGSGSCAHR